MKGTLLPVGAASVASDDGQGEQRRACCNEPSRDNHSESISGRHLSPEPSPNHRTARHRASPRRAYLPTGELEAHSLNGGGGNRTRARFLPFVDSPGFQRSAMTRLGYGAPRTSRAVHPSPTFPETEDGRPEIGWPIVYEDLRSLDEVAIAPARQAAVPQDFANVVYEGRLLSFGMICSSTCSAPVGEAPRSLYRGRTQ